MSSLEGQGFLFGKFGGAGLKSRSTGGFGGAGFLIEVFSGAGLVRDTRSVGREYVFSRHFHRVFPGNS